MIDKVARFLEHERLLTAKCRVIAAVSGGADSVCLLRVLKQIGYDCIAAHCNFALRGEESDRDEDFVRKLCQDLDVELHCIRFDTRSYAATHKLSIEMAARELRYRWFEQLRIQCRAEAIAVAHHRDDAIETCLLNLLRGTGIQGLTGIPARNGAVVRPLLAVDRREICDWLQSIGQSYVTDSTNLENDYTRNKIRNRLLPLLEEINPQVRQTLFTDMENFAAAAHIYHQAIDAAKAGAVEEGEGCRWIDLEAVKAFAEPKTLLFALLQPYGFHPAEIGKILAGTTGNCHRGRNGELTLVRRGRKIWGKLQALGTNKTERLG